MPRREIKTHHVNAVNRGISIFAMDEPGADGSNRKYLLEVRRNGPEGKPDGPLHSVIHIDLHGGPAVEGTNGLTKEALLAVVADNLEGLQRGPYKCDENGDALGMTKSAATCLLKRTQRRTAAGTEGTLKPDEAAPAAIEGEHGPGA